MPVLSIKSFGGIAPKVPARFLDGSQAQVALNCPVFNGSIQPLPDAGAAVHTLTKSGAPKSIYRFGQDAPSDVNYWFHWASDVDVCRGQIAGDVSEWTFFTGDGGPKATYNALALGNNDYPTVSRPLGLPAPTTGCTALANAFTADEHSAEVYLTSSHIGELSTTYGLFISLLKDDDVDYTQISLSAGTSADEVVTAITAASLALTAVADGTSVKLTTTAKGEAASLHVKYQTGSEPDDDQPFTYELSPNLTANGTADTAPFLVVEDAEVGSISIGDTINIYTTLAGGEAAVSFDMTELGTAPVLAAAINAAAEGKVVAAAYGSSIAIIPGTEATGASGVIRYARNPIAGGVNYVYNPDTGVYFNSPHTSMASESPAPASIIITQADIDAMEDKSIELIVNDGDPIFRDVANPATVADLTSLESYGVSVKTYGAVSPFAVLSTNATGTSATISLRGGARGETPTFTTQSSDGYIDDDLTTETRIYTWTWVAKEGGFTFESAPAPASGSVEVKTGQTVSISGLSDVPVGGYIVTNRRIYRSVNGVYLFVKEIKAALQSTTDDVEPEALAEELPTMTWSEPPQALSGLTNLPNGMMAGFVGRDVYFCDPYHPHAWPEQYIQTIDYPIVGLGRMDTTLAVLTTGTPYFIQGTHPLGMAVVKADLEQACVSKRSIVSHGGAVFYAAPDGIMRLAPGGSSIVTKQYFSYKQWQSYFKPETIHAYQHDNQYIAFFDNGTSKGGFIFDMTSGQFILHDMYAEAGFQDIQRDKLFLAMPNKELRVWGDGAPKDYIWKSKKFTMPKPLSFGWGQVEAEAYPVTVTFYADGDVAHTQSVTSRDPFRLPVKVGRDWEMQVEGSTEVFSMALAHSAAELRDA